MIGVLRKSPFKCVCCFFEQQTARESHDADSPRRGDSPRQTGRAGSPGARISWLTAAKSGVGGQVMLNNKGNDSRGRGRCGVLLHYYPGWSWTMEKCRTKETSTNQSLT